MSRYSPNAERLYTLLADLSPDLLAEALPEAGAPSPTPPIYSPKRHIRRLVRAIAIYAACAMLVLASLVLLPKLLNQQDMPLAPLTDPLGTLLPDGYYRDDLIWANEENSLHTSEGIGTQAAEQLYISFSPPNNASEDARYAVRITILKEDNLYSADTNEYYPLSMEDRTAFHNYLLSLGCEIFEVGECHSLVTGNTGIYYAATYAQMEAIDPETLYNAMGLHLTEIPGICVELGYQLLHPYEIPEYWTPDSKTTLYTYWKQRCNTANSSDALKLEPLSPIVDQTKQSVISFSLSHEPSSCHEFYDCKQTHTFSPNYSMRLQVKLNNQWYFVPLAATSAVTAKEECSLTNGKSETVTLRLNELYGILPDGYYRVALSTHIPFTQFDWNTTAYAEFVVYNRQKARIVPDPEGDRVWKNEVFAFPASTVESIAMGTTYQEITAMLGAPILDVTGEGKVFQHPTQDGFPINLIYEYSDSALRLTKMEYAIEKATDFPADYYRPDLIWANSINTDALTLYSLQYTLHTSGPQIDLFGVFDREQLFITMPDDPTAYAVYVTWEAEALFETEQTLPEDYDQRIHQYLTETIGLSPMKPNDSLELAPTPTGYYYAATRKQLSSINFEFMTSVDHPRDLSITLSFHLGVQPIHSTNR